MAKNAKYIEKLYYTQANITHAISYVWKGKHDVIECYQRIHYLCFHVPQTHLYYLASRAKP